MKIYSESHVGVIRTENQDRVWSGMLTDNACAIVLCDGMGGENAGSYASETAINIITEKLKSTFSESMNRNAIRNLLITSVTAANTAVHEIASTDEAKRGMGTTCVAMIVFEERAHIINVGDSRAYRIYDDCIMQITKDHTFIRHLLESGKITEDEAKKHPDRNCITRAVGAEATITPDYFELDLGENDIILLCSDGLSSYGDDGEIADIALSNPINKVCGKLIEYANQNGGKDNVTVGVYTR